MAKKRYGELGVDTEAYVVKQLAYKAGYQLPQQLAIDLIRDSVQKQLQHYEAGFGGFHKAWTKAVTGVLQAHNVPSIQWGPYRAAMNEYVKKVLGGGKNTGATMSEDLWLQKYTALGLNGDILREMAKAIKQEAEELGGILG